MAQVPVNDTVTFQDLTNDPYQIYKKMRAQTPLVQVSSLNRVFVTKAADCRYVKDNPEIFSSDDPSTPMERAFEAHTLMRKDGAEHMQERQAMMPAFSPRNLKSVWAPLYEKHAAAYLDRLPKDEVVDLFPLLAGPLAARILAECMGIPDVNDEDMQNWSQALIDGAGNFAMLDEPFERTDRYNRLMNTAIRHNAERLKTDPDQSALSHMVNASDPIAWEQILANVKIAIGGGINEPRDAILTILYGLLTNPDQLEAIKTSENWSAAFEEGVRWCAPIQASSRVAREDTQIRGYDIAKGSVIMTIQASANHDEEVVEDGHLYNALRTQSVSHQSFGSGPHHCMGTHLSRLLVGKTLLPMIFDRFPNIRLEHPQDVTWTGFGFRGPINFPVRLN